MKWWNQYAYGIFTPLSVGMGRFATQTKNRNTHTMYIDNSSSHSNNLCHYNNYLTRRSVNIVCHQPVCHYVAPLLGVSKQTPIGARMMIFQLAEQKLVKNNPDDQIQNITLCNMYFSKKLRRFREFLC